MEEEAAAEEAEEREEAVITEEGREGEGVAIAEEEDEATAAADAAACRGGDVNAASSSFSNRARFFRSPLDGAMSTAAPRVVSFLPELDLLSFGLVSSVVLSFGFESPSLPLGRSRLTLRSGSPE